jgi:DNA polymerase-3 subunit epsilon
MEILDRPVAITDVETSGLDPARCEIIDIGMVLVDQHNLKVIDRLNLKVKPDHPEVFSEEARKINGYNESGWQHALGLPDVMEVYSRKTKDAIFCAHNVTFDWAFIEAAFKKTGVKNLMDYHRLDLLTMAWLKFRNSGLKRLNMNEVAKFLGIPEEPLPHRGINGAMTEYEIFKKIVEQS